MQRTIPSAALLATILALAAAGADEPRVGTISGVLRFTGKAPPAEAVPVADGTTIQHRPLVIDAESKGLQNVFVVLADAPKQPQVKGARPVVMDQRDWVFLPRVAAVQAGQEVEFQNNDGVNHGVQTSSPLAENQFNVVLGTGRDLRFQFAPQNEPIVIGCALHAWMRGWIFVVRHPWFAVTDAKGSFQMNDVPPGTYRLECAHPDTGLRAIRTVVVKAGEKTRIAIEWDRLPPGK